MHLVIIIFLIIHPLFGLCEDQVMNPLLHCLGSEESTFHKNKTIGPVYRINKIFIDELTLFDQIFLKDHYLKEICFNSTTYSPSVNLLRHILLFGEDLFDIKASLQLVNKIALKSSIHDLVSKTPSIFLTWLSEIQASAPSYNCLDKYIPEIAEMKITIKYLEEEVGFTKIVNSDKVDIIFTKLKTLDNIFEKCKNDQKKREQEILKGKVF